jgi:cell wall-associated NlpC family hydrolase
LPRTSGEQFVFAIPVNNPTVGDLVFFKRNGRIYHVGIYIGNDSIIHAAINKGVRVESIKGNSLERTLAGYGRVNFG